MSARQSAEYLQTLDSAVSSANEALRRTITTRAGLVSQNPNLDGFIAEQYHAQTFNLNAAARGSEYRAEVPVPDGRFGKNSVDIMIKDGAGKIARKFQSKYCKDAEATLDAFNHGDYRGSGKLVSSDQLEDVSRVTKATDRIAAPDGTTSNPLAKSGAERMRDEARSGKWNDLNWNEYKTKDIAAGMGKQVGQSVIMGAAVGAGFSVAQKLWEGEEIDGAEIVETAVKSGADFGVKAAAAAALKAGAEKGILTFIPKGTPAGTIANVAFVAVENVKVLGEIADGELSPVEGLEKMERVTVSTVAGIAASVKAGAAATLALAPVLGPLAPVAGFVAGTVAYMAGSAVAEAVVSAAQKVRRVAVDTVKTVCEGAKSIVSGVSNFVGSIFGW
jgi:hypothetical protein